MTHLKNRSFQSSLDWVYEHLKRPNPAYIAGRIGTNNAWLPDDPARRTGNGKITISPPFPAKNSWNVILAIVLVGFAAGWVQSLPTAHRYSVLSAEFLGDTILQGSAMGQ